MSVSPSEDFDLIRADQIRVGDFLDLEGDLYADPQKENSLFEFEFVEVGSTEIETPQCVCLHIEGVDAFGFPLDHLLRRSKRCTSSNS